MGQHHEPPCRVCGAESEYERGDGVFCDECVPRECEVCHSWVPNSEIRQPQEPHDDLSVCASCDHFYLKGKQSTERAIIYGDRTGATFVHVLIPHNVKTAYRRIDFKPIQYAWSLEIDRSCCPLVAVLRSDYGVTPEQARVDGDVRWQPIAARVFGRGYAKGYEDGWDLPERGPVRIPASLSHHREWDGVEYRRGYADGREAQRQLLSPQKEG